MRPAPDHVQAAADAVMVALGWPADRLTLVVEVVKTLDDHHLLNGSPTAPGPTAEDVEEAARLLAGYSPRYGYEGGWRAIVEQPGNLHHAYTAARQAARTVVENNDIARAYDVVNGAQRRGSAPTSR